jgi:ParB family chromosome partitioning protein
MNRRPLGRGLDALIQSTTREGNDDLVSEALPLLVDPSADIEAMRRRAESDLTAEAESLSRPADLAPETGSGSRSEADLTPSPFPKGKGGQNGAESNGALQLIALERIVPGRFQPRQYFAEAALAELAEAIKAQGIIEPLVARRSADGYELIAGERRLRAARIAGLAVVPVMVRDLDDRAALEMSLVENLLREDLNVVEEGQAFARLSHEFALTHDAIAARVGKSRSYVTNIIRLMELPEEVLQMIGRGELTGGQVRPLLALSSPEAQLAEARKIAESKISSRHAEEIASAKRGARRGQGIRAAHVDDPNLIALAESLQRALKRKVRIVRRRGKSPGRVELEFYNDDDLTGLARTLAVSGRGAGESSRV